MHLRMVRNANVSAVSLFLCAIVSVAPFAARGQETNQARKAFNLAHLSIAAGRTFTRVQARQPRAEINLWLTASQIVPEITGVELLVQLPLMTEAEQNRYTIARIEFVGNEHIRDQALRQRTRSLKEGEIFRTAVLRQSLRSLNRLKIIVPIAVKDVEARLHKEERSVDLLIPIRER